MATLTSYSFTLQVDYPDLLISAIQSSSIQTPLSYLERSGQGSSMSVIVWFVDVLSSADQTTLSSLITNYVNSLPTSQIAAAQVAKDISFGLGLIAQFSTQNRIANLSTGNVAQIAEQLAPVQSLLLSGSIETALTVIQGITPSALLTQDVINNYITQLQNYLNTSVSV